MNLTILLYNERHSRRNENKTNTEMRENRTFRTNKKGKIKVNITQLKALESVSCH